MKRYRRNTILMGLMAGSMLSVFPQQGAPPVTAAPVRRSSIPMWILWYVGLAGLALGVLGLGAAIARL